MGKRSFIRWIQIINAAIVRKNLQDLFQQYQVAVFDYLYEGNQMKTTQLEDIRNYAININNAINVKNHILEYVGEQKNHRDLCLASTPEQWVKTKSALTITKTIPEEAESMKAVDADLPNTLPELKMQKKRLQKSITVHRHRLLYQHKYVQPVQNPMPEGYTSEMKKLQIVKLQSEIERVNNKIIEVEKELTNQTED